MKKKWLFTAIMIVIAAVAVGGVAWSYKGINEKMNLENERQTTMSLVEAKQKEDTLVEKPLEDAQNEKCPDEGSPCGGRKKSGSKYGRN